MANFFKSVVSAGKSALDLFQGSTDPNTVKSVSPNDFATTPVQDREDCMVLYGPRDVTIKKKETIQIFDIVVLSEKNHTTAFSLCRFTEKDEAKKRFEIYKRSIPAILNIDRDICTIAYLQQICDVIKDNESLSIAHIAVSLDLKNVLTSTMIETMYNLQDKDGQTPIMLAAKKQNVYALKHLVGKNVDLSLVDGKLNNVFHIAATSSKDVIEILGEKPTLLSQKNGEGFTPLHIACHQDMPDCVQALLCSGADINLAGTMDDDAPLVTAVKSSSTRCVKEILQLYPKQLHVQDIKHGGTPLHWAKSKEIVVALIEANGHVDAKNFKGDTALHVMTKHGRIDCVVALIAHGAQIDTKDAFGNTCLHIACEEGFETIIKALIVFEADASILNDKGDSAFKIAVEKATNESYIKDALQSKDRKGIVYMMHLVGANCNSEIPDKLKSHKKSTKDHSPAHKRTRILFDDVLANAAKKGRKGPSRAGGRLLSLDGGGIKGLVLTRMLLSMEKVWNEPVVNCFDWMAGTSTGGILALALATGKSVMECQQLYFRLKDKIFVGSRPYDTKPLEELLQETFGLTRMKDIQNIKVVITATTADRCPPDLHLFRSYPAPQEMLGVAEYEHPELQKSGSPSRSVEMMVWRAARASGAAPTFFRSEGHYVDGGIISNNPTIDLLTEITEFNIAQKAVGHDEDVVEPSVLLSLGTGVLPVQKTNADFFWPENITDAINFYSSVQGMFKIMVESLLDADGPIVDRARAWCTSLGISYYRFSPLMTSHIELDEKDDKTLIDLMWSAMVLVHNRRDDVLRLKKLLLPNSGLNTIPSMSSIDAY